MSLKLQINNNAAFHYEIIESVIIKYRELFVIDVSTNVDIFINLKHNNNSFVEYIKSKYPTILFTKINNYDYYIECTSNTIVEHTNPIKRYIAHEVNRKLLKSPLIWYLTPIAPKNVITANIMPYADKMKPSNIPIYIVQGGSKRRNWNLLDKILSTTYKEKFNVKIVGKNELPTVMKKHKTKFISKINLNFIDYHKQFLDAYCILPLITVKSHEQYYKRKLTSTINYASGYNLKCLIDKDLQDIYHLDNVEVFNNEDDIVEAFQKTLHDFYSSK
tara:strand:+ start:2406 stop:3230 length:825 start_codon:yes stop_codon:yes gene_type:complete